jgi:hypothetical protein
MLSKVNDHWTEVAFAVWALGLLYCWLKAGAANNNNYGELAAFAYLFIGTAWTLLISFVCLLYLFLRAFA